jgi:hypothetical protein
MRLPVLSDAALVPLGALACAVPAKRAGLYGPLLLGVAAGFALELLSGSLFTAARAAQDASATAGPGVYLSIGGALLLVAVAVAALHSLAWPVGQPNPWGRRGAWAMLWALLTPAPIGIWSVAVVFRAEGYVPLWRVWVPGVVVLLGVSAAVAVMVGRAPVPVFAGGVTLGYGIAWAIYQVSALVQRGSQTSTESQLLAAAVLMSAGAALFTGFYTGPEKHRSEGSRRRVADAAPPSS